MGPHFILLASVSSNARLVSALMDVALIAGFVLLFVGLAVQRPLPLAASALLLFLAAIPLSMGIFGLPVGAASAAILLAARRVGSPSAAARWLARGVGALAGAILVAISGDLLMGGPVRVAGPALAYSALMMLVLGALALVGWWPWPAAGAVSERAG